LLPFLADPRVRWNTPNAALPPNGQSRIYFILKDQDKVPDETELHPSLSFVPPNPPIAATTQYPTAILKHKFN
jgi:hypothetical protein